MVIHSKHINNTHKTLTIMENKYENDPYNDDTQKAIAFTGLVLFIVMVILGVLRFILQFM